MIVCAGGLDFGASDKQWSPLACSKDMTPLDEEFRSDSRWSCAFDISAALRRVRCAPMAWMATASESVVCSAALDFPGRWCPHEALAGVSGKRLNLTRSLPDPRLEISRLFQLATCDRRPA